MGKVPVDHRVVEAFDTSGEKEDTPDCSVILLASCKREETC